MSEQFKNPENFDLRLSVTYLREQIGNLPDFRQPNAEEVLTTIEAVFPSLSEKDKRLLYDAFMQSEQSAAAEADRLADEMA